MSLRNASTKDAGISGAKIRVDGGLWLKADVISPSFSQKLHLYDPMGRSGAIQFVASRDLVGKFTIQGSYPAENMRELSVIKSGTTLTDTVLALNNNVSYSGDVIFESVSTKAKTQAETIPYTANCRFTGVINTDANDAESINSGDSGSTQFGKSAGNFSEQAEIGYQDDHQDRYTYPFIIQGIDENTVDLWEAVDNAIQTLSGTTKTTRGPSADAPYVQSGVGRWAGRGVVQGTFVYGRGPRDCSPGAASVSIGFTTQGTQTQDIIDSGDSGDSGNFCNTEGIGVQVRQRIKRPVPIKTYRIPGVWESNPANDANLDAMVGRINTSAYTIDGSSKGIKSLRCDGVETQAHKTPAGTFWSGHLKFTEMVGGWKTNKLTCIQYVQMPLEGTQTVPGYTLAANSVWLYRYPHTTFTTVANLIPDCGY